MYSVSNDYITKMLEEVQTHKLSGTIDSISFTGDDVIGVSYNNKCSNKNVNIGGVNIGTLKLTFLRDILNRGDYLGKTITISDSLLLGYDADEEPIWESVPIGVFYVSEATWSAKGMIDIVAYDCMSKLDDTLNIDTSSGTIYSFCKYIETQTNTTFGMTEEECQALPNGTELLSPYEDNDLNTYRDLLSALAQMCGGFATATRDGSWIIKNFGSASVLTVNKNRRMSGSKYSDFTTLYDAISYTDVKTGMNYVVGPNNGLVMKLGSNPFLQYGSVDAIDRRLNAIITAILPMTYNPYVVSVLPALACLDLGDVVSFTDDYSENTSYGAIMGVTWTYNKSFSVTSYGDNPNLRSAQSQVDKNISGLIRQTSQNEVTYYNFANVQEINIEPDVETSIAKIRFASAQPTTVKILHEFIMDMIADLSDENSYELRYYLDDELISYKPYESIDGLYGATSGDTEFSICRDFFYILKDVQPNISHTWEVKILTHGIDSTIIDVNHAHITVEGQRLYGEGYFDGFVEAEDELTLIPLGYLSLISISESTDFIFKNVVLAQGTDIFGLIDLGTMQELPIEDYMQMFMESLKFIRITEDGYNRFTEDGKRRITE